MLDLKRHVAVTLTILLLTADGQASEVQYPAAIPQSVYAALLARAQVATPPSQSLYETRQVHDPDGTGKFYIGREIAETMGPGGIAWLDRPERNDEERPGVVIEALGLRDGETVAGDQ